MQPRSSSPPLPSGTPAALQLRLLGAVEVCSGHADPIHWPSRAAAALLARLALAPQRAHPREELVELLWPGVALDVGRNRLRQTLSTLKSLLEAGPAAGPVISADRSALRLLPGTLVCDAVEFERQVRAGAWADALASYRGEFMPGHYDDWVLETRARLEALHERAEAQVPAPPAMPVGAAATHLLPASWTRVFGIEHSATRLLALVRHERLVTVIGPGGCGKTRLALEAARAPRDAPDWSLDVEPATLPALRFARIVFVPLADCHDEAQAAAALARVLGVSGRDPLRQIQALLAGPPALLVLDNFEQLVASAQGLLMSLLEGVPSLHLLVTSRLRLGLPGEQVFVLDGLPLPEVAAAAAAEVDVESAALNPAVALFVDRARAARADFHLDAPTLPAVCTLVRLLDGMPLSLELAASRAGQFSPAQMLQLLSDDSNGGAHLALLSRSGPRAGHDRRHASIGEVIAWSWRLLRAPEQRLMAALSVYAGDAGLQSLAAVLDEPEAVVAARLDDLAGHSLLRISPAAGPAQPLRASLVEPVREFVRSQWPAADLQQLRHALQSWLTGWAQALGPAPPRAAVEAELHNVIAMLAAPGPDAGRTDGVQRKLELARALRTHWDSAGMPAMLQSALEHTLARHEAEGGPAAAPLASEVHELLAYVRFEAGFAAEALVHADAAVRLAGSDPSRRARALVRRAWVDLAAGRTAVDDRPHTAQLQAWLTEALDLARRCNDAESQARALHQEAVIAKNLLSDPAGAEALLERSQQLWLLLGHRRKAFARLRNRAQCWVELGRTEDALACFELCERSAREDGDVVEQIDSQVSLSSLLSARRQWQAALEVDRRCVALCWQSWHRHGLAYALWNPPLALAHLRRPEDALRLMAFAATFWESTFGPLARGDRHTVYRVRRLVRAQCGAARTELLWAEGAAMDIAAAVALALRA
jgi:predicted ATPase/tetratricopeptide (TPR) repeat protein